MMRTFLYALIVTAGLSAGVDAEPQQHDTQHGHSSHQELAGKFIAAMTPELVVEIRRLLYVHGYPIRHFDPDLGPDLEQSINLFQSRSGGSTKGRLTQIQIEQLRLAVPPGQWGAISYTGTGGHVGASRRTSRAIVEAETIEECTTKTRKRCQTIAVSGSQCVILVHSIHNDGYRPVVQNFVVFGREPTELRKTALAECKSKAQISANCEIRRVVCADGR